MTATIQPLNVTGIWRDGRYTVLADTIKKVLRKVKMGRCKRHPHEYNKGADTYTLSKGPLLVVNDDFFIPAYHIKKLSQTWDKDERIHISLDTRLRHVILEHGASKTVIKSRNDFDVTEIVPLRFYVRK